MKKTSKLILYKLIIDKVRNKPCTFKEIDEYLSDTTIHGEDLSISKRTFNRYQQEISQIFGVDISYNFATEVYEIEFSESENVTNRLIEALDTFTALNMDNSISKYIELEKKPVAGTENLHPILNAVKQKKVMVFHYHKYWQNTKQIRTIHPYLLKEHGNRWYVIGKDPESNKIRSFGLDRIKDIIIQGNTFNIDKTFDRSTYFKDSFGIMMGSDYLKPKKVVLEFTVSQGKYVKSLPLHHSQRVIEDNEERLVIELNLVFTFDFYQELLSHGEFVKVLEPKEVRQEMAYRLKEALKHYQND